MCKFWHWIELKVPGIRPWRLSDMNQKNPKTNPSGVFLEKSITGWAENASFKVLFKFHFGNFWGCMLVLSAYRVESAFAVRPHSDLPKCFLLWFMRKWFAQTLVGSVLLIHQHRGCVRKQTLLSFFQMSKSTGNFLTLTQAVDKFSADGECVLTCIWLSIMPKWLKWVFCSQRSLLEYWMAINLPLTTCSCWKAELHLEDWDVC